MLHNAILTETNNIKKRVIFFCHYLGKGLGYNPDIILLVSTKLDERRGGLVIRSLDFGSSGSGSIPRLGCHVVSLGKTL